MRYYESSATIDAPVSRVWETLVDGATWPTWDSGVERVEGTIAPGATVKVVSSANPSRAFPVKVTELQPERSMTFSGGMPLGLFRGVRRYTLTPAGDKTEFRMREEYTGPLLPLIWKSMPDLQPSFDQFAAGLKQRTEQRAG
jgi:hypothetical protein